MQRATLTWINMREVAVELLQGGEIFAGGIRTLRPRKWVKLTKLARPIPRTHAASNLLLILSSIPTVPMGARTNKKGLLESSPLRRAVLLSD
jgi:hypothetical protein